MNKIFFKAVAVMMPMMAVSVSCVEEQMNDAPVVSDVEFFAANESTRTGLNADMKTVEWKEGDQISILAMEDNLLYTASSAGASTGFATETAGVKTNAGSVWAVYPYSDNNKIVEGNVTVTVPSSHEVSAEGFAQDANVTVAYCSELKPQTQLSFKNVCSYLKVKLSQAQAVKKIVLSSDRSVAIAGEALVKMNASGEPEIVSVSEPVTSVELVGPDALDGTYLIPVLPGDAAKWTLAFTKTDGTESTVAIGSEAAPFVRNSPLYYDFTSADINWKVAPSAVTADKVFWSDAHVSWTHSGKVDAYKVYAGDKLIASVDNGVKTAHLTGLENGTKYSVKVAAVYGAEEKVSDEIEITTGAMIQLTRNVSPTSVAVNIENRAGALSGNFMPCLYVQLFESEDANSKPLYELFVRDNEAQSEGHPFYKSLVAGSGTTYPPFNLAFGGLEAGKDYWFRVKSVASDVYVSYRSSQNLGGEYTQTSQNGGSEYSQLIKLSTASSHVAEEGEIFYEGFDDFSFGPDFINCAVGLMPAFRTFAKSPTYTATLNKTIWESWKNNDKPWCFHGLRTCFPMTHIAGLGFVNLQKGDTAATFDGVDAAASRYWVTESTLSTTLKAPKVLAGARVGSFQVSSTTGFTSLVGDTRFVTADSYTGEGYFVLGYYYGSGDTVNSSRKPAGFFAKAEGSLSTSTATACVVSFKALAVQGTTGNITAIHLGRDNNHREVTTDLWQTVGTIAIANSNGETGQVATSWSATADTHRWYDYSFEVDLKKGDLIGLTTDGNSCICLDEVKITLK